MDLLERLKRIETTMECVRDVIDVHECAAIKHRQGMEREREQMQPGVIVLGELEKARVDILKQITAAEDE